jgi:succinate dehydrogenase hydrophobic anchor subunit
VVKAGFSGLKAWWVQRVSAVYMLLFVLFLFYSFAVQPLSIS